MEAFGRSYRNCNGPSSEPTHSAAILIIKYPPVLTSWSTMKIDDHFQTVVSSPPNGFLKIRQLTLNKGFTPGYVESPVTDGDSDVVQSVR